MDPRFLNLNKNGKLNPSKRGNNIDLRSSNFLAVHSSKNNSPESGFTFRNRVLRKKSSKKFNMLGNRMSKLLNV